jgi:hypothetical protein
MSVARECCICFQLFVFLLCTGVLLWLMLLVASLSQQRPGFMPVSVPVGFVVDRVVLGEVSLPVIRFYHIN